MSIRLSPKHGVNPAVPLCFCCGKPKQEVVLAGCLPGDAEAPQHVAWDREPCDECQGWMKKGVILISVDEAKSDDLQNPYRTGGWCVLTDAAIQRMVRPGELRVDLLKRRVAFLPDAVWDLLGLPRHAMSEGSGA